MISHPILPPGGLYFMKRGKKYQDAVKAYDRSAQYDVAEAIDLVKKNATAKFDETIELHLRTGCDGRHAEQVRPLRYWFSQREPR